MANSESHKSQHESEVIKIVDESKNDSLSYLNDQPNITEIHEIEEIKEEIAKDEMIENENDTRCDFYCCAPKWSQKLRSRRIMLLSISWSALTQVSILCSEFRL